MSVLESAAPIRPQRSGRALAPADVHALFADGVVRHGPFAGLRYPTLQSIGSSLYPKLLGSYEAELHPWIDEVCAGTYSEVVDVGCAEGYYAVGLALRLRDAWVYAYDTSTTAQELCAACARANGVETRVRVGAAFDAGALAGITVRRRGLIVCDCEGAEMEIFTPETAPAFASWDLLIETHDFMDITISSRCADLFRATHDERACLSVDDIQKAKHYAHPELTPLDLATRRAIVGEGRPAIMEWLFLSARARSGRA